MVRSFVVLVISTNLDPCMGNAVVLPNGFVIVIERNRQAITFDGSQAVLTAEMWDPVTETFPELHAPMQIPRTYHSSVILVQDGRILAAGGGLCGPYCGLNYFTGEILSPPYLFASDGSLAERPVIKSSPATAKAGDVVYVVTTSCVVGRSFAFVRPFAATHVINNDLRRIPCQCSRSTLIRIL